MTDITTGHPEKAPGSTGRQRRPRVKTVRVKTILMFALLILLVAAIIFGVLYYRGNRPLDGIEPVFAINPPHFLYNIYGGGNKFSHPIAVSVTKSGQIYVSNNDKHTVEIITPNGKPEGVLGGAGSKPGNILFPYGIGILPDGNILVAETGNFRIQEFTPAGKFVKTFVGQPNKIGLTKPGPVSVDSSGRIYVGDISGNQVLVFDRTGKVLRRIGNISYPHGIAVDEERNRLYVSDSGALNVKVFSLDNNSEKPIRVIETWEPDGMFSMVRGIAVDKMGRLYVADTIVSTIRVFDKDGAFLFSFGNQGNADGEFLYPNGVTVDDTGKIFVADWSNNRVQVWGY